MKNYNQNGRTMIETLSVLGLVGILTIGAIYGFEEMLNKHKANEIWNELKSRAMTLSMQNVGKVPYNLNEYNTNVQGATIELVQGDNDTFSMVAKGVPEKVCLEMLKNAPAECMEIASTTITTSADTTTYNTAHAYPKENRDTVCSPLTDTLNLVFTYNSDLGTDSLDDSDSGSGSENNNQNQGTGGIISNCRIQDNKTKACLSCDEGYKKASDGVSCEAGSVCHDTSDCPGAQICVEGNCGCPEIERCQDYNQSTCACATCSSFVTHCGTYTVQNSACTCTACEAPYIFNTDKTECITPKYRIGTTSTTWNAINAAENNTCPTGYRWISKAELEDTNIFADQSARAKLFSTTGGLCYGCNGQSQLWTSTLANSSFAWRLWSNGGLEGYNCTVHGGYALCVLE